VRVDGKKARTSGRDTLSSSRTAPLKPKEGLNGPPVQIRSLQPCHPERNFVIGEAANKAESKDPQQGEARGCPIQAFFWLEWELPDPRDYPSLFITSAPCPPSQTPFPRHATIIPRSRQRSVCPPPGAARCSRKQSSIRYLKTRSRKGRCAHS